MSDKKENNKNKDIEVITGNGKDLNISPVYDHVKMDKNYSKKNKNVIVPNSKK